MAAIFISYRREDSAGYAGRICEHLSGVFGADSVFMDVQDIVPGEDFTTAIGNTIAKCDMLVAIVGPSWLASLQARQQQEDFVRHEIAAALRRGIPVIPLLVGGAKMPTSQALPESLAPFARYQAAEIRDNRFDGDLQVLVDAVRRIIKAPAKTQRRVLWRLLIPVPVLAVVAVFFLMGRPASIDLNGVWMTEMQKAGQRPYRVRLELMASSSSITGKVSYPTGDGVIKDGAVHGSQISFSTIHLPQFATEPATIRYTGKIIGREIHLVSADSSGVAEGVARKTPQ